MWLTKGLGLIVCIKTSYWMIRFKWCIRKTFLVQHIIFVKAIIAVHTCRNYCYYMSLMNAYFFKHVLNRLLWSPEPIYTCIDVWNTWLWKGSEFPWYYICTTRQPVPQKILDISSKFRGQLCRITTSAWNPGVNGGKSFFFQGRTCVVSGIMGL